MTGVMQWESKGPNLRSKGAGIEDRIEDWGLDMLKSPKKSKVKTQTQNQNQSKTQDF
jgi:hypothetical protein